MIPMGATTNLAGAVTPEQRSAVIGRRLPRISKSVTSFREGMTTIVESKTRPRVGLFRIVHMVGLVRTVFRSTRAGRIVSCERCRSWMFVGRRRGVDVGRVGVKAYIPKAGTRR